MMFRRRQIRDLDQPDRLLHARISALENRIDDYAHGLQVALTGDAAAQAKADLRQVGHDAGNELNRERDVRANVFAEIEGLRAELDHFRQKIGSAISVDLSR